MGSALAMLSERSQGQSGERQSICPVCADAAYAIATSRIQNARSCAPSTWKIVCASACPIPLLFAVQDPDEFRVSLIGDIDRSESLLSGSSQSGRIRPGFVIAGPAAAELADDIAGLIDRLGCE
jgi:hypothetical protein